MPAAPRGPRPSKAPLIICILVSLVLIIALTLFLVVYYVIPRSSCVEGSKWRESQHLCCSSQPLTKEDCPFLGVVRTCQEQSGGDDCLYCPGRTCLKEGSYAYTQDRVK